MKATEKIIELIKNCDEDSLQKNMMISFIDRANNDNDLKSADRLLIEETGVKNLNKVVLSTDEVKIFTVISNNNDEWDTKYPYRSIFLNKNGVWLRNYTVSPSLDLAYLSYLEKKHLGDNKQFVDFAIKMLEIKIGD